MTFDRSVYPTNNQTWRILTHASENNYALGAYNCYNDDGVIAVIWAADRKGSAAIIQLFPWTMHFQGAEFVRYVVNAAHSASVHIVVHMDYLGVLQHLNGSKAAGWVAIVSIYIHAIGYAISRATVPWIINSEVFSMSVRSTCMAVCITWQYLVNFALTRAVPNMLISMHSYGPFTLFACATVLGLIYSTSSFPRRRG
ncbi:general substrate transporter [Penicillium capsulatum]|uniref:Fructose-bisphosphate aldolase n=1 Tax=Penicillium capsulatum TaxID=69766 RepID=A0A9W9IU20_9EURO|nr:general substrate transporter [Penicillium capsulatum]KAJ6129294.1 general substrate transporter [Penicillium capsulatum]